jgi:hypothetical protein
LAYDSAGNQLWVARYNPSPNPSTEDEVLIGGDAAALSGDGSRLSIVGTFLDPANSANVSDYGVLSYDTGARR